MSDGAQLAIIDMPITAKTLSVLAEGPAVPERYKGKPGDLMAAILVGRGLGIGEMEAINSLFIVDGTISMTGKLMSALVHRQGHQLRVQMTKDKSTVTCFRRDPYTHLLDEVGVVTFTTEDAERALLLDKPTYKAYPAVMLTWRAVSQACRIYFADCLSGVAYIPEEINVAAPLEVLDMDSFAGVEVDGVDLDLENATAEVVNVLDADVLDQG
jgi:hypothetical protein